MTSVFQEIVDELDALGASTELMGHWQAKESAFLSGVGVAEAESHLPQHARDLALRFMSNTFEQASLPKSCWFNAALLFDAYSERKAASAKGFDVSRLPATCLALVSVQDVLYKDDSSIYFRPSDFSYPASKLWELLRESGHPGREEDADFTFDGVRAQELDLLEVLQWRLDVITTEKWFLAWCDRINACTRKRFVPSLTWMRDCGLKLARTFVLARPHSCELPPRDVASGIFCLSVVMSGVIPSEVVRREAVDPTTWSQQIGHIMNQLIALPPAQGSLDHSADQKEYLQWLEFSTGCLGEDLIDACGVVVAVLLEGLPQNSA